MTRIAVFCSGGGTNLQALLNKQKQGLLGGGVISLVIASRKSAYALERARLCGIAAIFLSRKTDPESYDIRMLTLLRQYGIELIVLAGFLSILGPETLAAYSGRIMNIHPALLPSFGGMGMYGHYVHEAVLAAGCKVSGATVHFANAGIDEGPIILQEAVRIFETDTADALAARVLAVEHTILPRAVALYCEGRIVLHKGRVTIR